MHLSDMSIEDRAMAKLAVLEVLTQAIPIMKKLCAAIVNGDDSKADYFMRILEGMGLKEWEIR